MNDKKVMPVTIITGFLGSGKTTLLNELLKQNTDTNFLIIENEFGKINIDSDLISNNSQNDIREFTSGCICCSLSTELGTLLNSLILTNAQYDYILIEATGIADPGQVIKMFTGERAQKYFKLDSVVGMVDAESFINRINEFKEAYNQIAQSDIVLINKSDLISDEKMAEVEQNVYTVNPFAKVEKTVHGRVKENKILNSELFQSSKTEKSISDFNISETADSTNTKTHQIKTLSYQIPGCFDMERLSVWLKFFLLMNTDNVLRLKGVLSVENEKNKIILQSVGKDYQLSKGSEWEEEDKKESKIIIIGTDLKEIENEIKEGLINLVRK
ncbi:MAG: GTP-binding protein [Rhodothermaceae bacterium]